VIAYYQKNKLKILLAVFCLALILPFFSLSKTALAADPEPGMLESYIVIPLLKTVLKFVTILLSVAETIFEWIVNPKTMLAIMTNSAVYTTWRAVRDVFNVVFIMVLLFSAFATVFQYSKFNYKNVLLNLVLMALLVNFSYPIARFIVDFSNIIMFGFLQSMGGDNSFMSIIKNSGLDKIIGGSNPGALFLLSAIIFTFILAITLLVIAVLLVIRTVSLTLYIIFSPLAFVGSVLPGTKLASAGNEWWTDFMKNCFAGPIIVFMLYVANVLMSAMASSGGQIKNIANVQVNGLEDPGNISQLITGVSIFILPIIVLWMGIIKSQESGIIGAKAVVSYGKRAMRWGSGLAFAANVQKAYQSRRAKAREDSWANKLGANLGSQQDRLRGAMLGGRDARLRYESDQLSKVKKENERNDMANLAPDQLRQIAENGNKFAQAAALQELANRNILDMNDPASAAAYQRMRDEFGVTSQTFNQINNKLKAFDPVSAFSHIANATERNDRIRDYINSNQFDAKKLGANSLRNEDFMYLAFQNQAISNKDLEDLRGKSIGHETNIRQSLENVANRFNNLANAPDPEEVGITAQERTRRIELTQQQRINRNVQMAHFAQNGRLHDSISGNPAYRSQIFSRLNKDTMKRIDQNTADTYFDEIAANMNISKYAEALPNVENRNVQRSLNSQIMDTAFGMAGNMEAEAFAQAVRRNAKLRNIR
jgi:hypothetical protein